MQISAGYLKCLDETGLLSESVGGGAWMQEVCLTKIMGMKGGRRG